MIKMKFKKLTAVFLSIAVAVTMAITLMPTVAHAASNPATFTFDISEGTIKVVSDPVNTGKLEVDYGVGQTATNIDPAQNITITGTAGAVGALVPNHVEILVACSVTLDNCNIYTNYINPDSGGGEVIHIQTPVYTDVVNMTLTGTNILRSPLATYTFRIDCYVGDLVIDGTGSLDVSGTGVNQDNGISGNAITIKGSPTIIATNCAFGGIQAGTDITIDGGSIDVSGSGSLNNALMANHNITINGGTIVAKNVNTSGTCAIFASSNNININGGTIDVSNCLDGIYVNSNLNITGGVINATNSGDIALYALGTIAISGGTIDASNATVNGLSSGTSTIITGGSINATSNVIPTDSVNNLSMYTVNLPGVSSVTPVKTLLVNGVPNTTYGLNDTFTDTSGNAYVWLPASLTGLQINVPTAPLNVVASLSPTTATNVDLTWTAPTSEGASAITGYKVIPYDVTTSKALAAVDTGSTNTNFTLTGLTQGDSYSFTVVATNSFGDSAPSLASNVVTTPILVTGVILDTTSADMTVGGGDLTLIATVSPDNATNKAVTWASSDPSVATVDANGIVHALSNGTATITVTTADGGFTATSIINVISVATSTTSTISAITSGNSSINTTPATGSSSPLIPISILIVASGAFLIAKKRKNI